MKKLLMLCLAVLVFLPVVYAAERIEPFWVVHGHAEDPVHHILYVVAREVGGAHRWIVTAHEMVQAERQADGSMAYSYRDEACVLYIDEDGDEHFTPKERRWKTTADHACALTESPVTLALDLAPDGSVAMLHVQTPPKKRHAESQVALLDVAGAAHVERQYQLGAPTE